MSTATFSGRLPVAIHRLLLRQVGPADKKSRVVSRHVLEGVVRRHYPGIAFRDGAAGREAYVAWHRLAVWEVAGAVAELDGQRAAAEHFGWPRLLVARAMDYAKDFSDEIEACGRAETE